MPKTCKYNIWQEKGELASLAQGYLTSLKERNYSPNTYRDRGYYLEFFVAWCRERDIELRQITRKVVEDYVIGLCQHPSKRCGGILSDNSRSRNIQTLQLFFRHLVKKRLILYNPVVIVAPTPQPKRLPNILTQTEVEAIINATDVRTPLGLRDRAILETLYSTGMRAQELVALRIDDLDMNRGTVLVYQGKGHKDRVVPIGERALSWITKYLQEVRSQKPCARRVLFLSQYDKPFRGSGSLRQSVRGYFKQAGVEKSGCCHIFRHTMATLMLQNGADIRYIQEILGHSNLQTTENYTKVTIEHLRQVQIRTHPAGCHDLPDNLPQPALPALASPQKPRGPRKTTDEFWAQQPTGPDDLITLGNRFFAVAKAENHNENTIQSRRNHLKAFVMWCRDRSVLKPADVTPVIIERYQSYIANTNIPGSDHPPCARARQNKLSSIKIFFRYLLTAGHVLHNPTDGLEAIKAPKRLPHNTLTHEQVEEILAQPNLATAKGLRDRAMLETIYSTGLRRLELARLQLSDIAFEAGTVMVRKGKGNKDRVVPIGERALYWLNAYIQQARPLQLIEPEEKSLFISKEGTRLHYKAVGNITSRYFQKAGKQGSCHTLRHAMATLMLENGADIRHIQSILGHSRLSTTEIYTKVSIQKLKEIHNLTHPAHAHPTPDQQKI